MSWYSTAETSTTGSTYGEALGGVKVVKVSVHQGGVLLQEVSVQRPHDKRYSMAVQLVCDVRGKRFRGDEAEELGAGCRVVVGPCCAQCLAELVGV